MANREQGELGVMVGGKAYTLCPTFDSFCEFEDVSGKDLAQLIAEIEQGRLSGLRAVTWCLLQERHADEIKVLKDASRWIERAGGPAVAQGWIRQVFQLNEPETVGDKVDSADPPIAQSGIGEPSSSVLVGTV